MRLALVCLLAAVTVGATPAPYGPVTPEKIFSNARLAMYLHAYPRYITYIIDVQSDAHGKHYHEGYRAMLRTHDNELVVKQTPVYTSNKPPNPYGWTFFGINRTGKEADHIPPPFGVPLMSATYDFGLARPPRALSLSEVAIRALEGATPTPAPKVLGNIEVTGGDYAVTLIGEETIDGHDTYHLGLTPLRDPQSNRVRDVWVDTTTFDVWQLTTQGLYVTGVASDAMWTVTFIQLHGYWFIRTESTTATLDSGGGIFGPADVYHGVSYTFGAYGYPGYISELEFIQPQLHTQAIEE